MGLVETKLAIIPGAGKTFYIIKSGLTFCCLDTSLVFSAARCVEFPNHQLRQFLHRGLYCSKTDGWWWKAVRTETNKLSVVWQLNCIFAHGQNTSSVSSVAAVMKWMKWCCVPLHELQSFSDTSAIVAWMLATCLQPLYMLSVCSTATFCRIPQSRCCKCVTITFVLWPMFHPGVWSLLCRWHAASPQGDRRLSR